MQFLFLSLFLALMQSYESQAYEVVASINSIEIRYYPSVMKVKAESSQRANNNFNALFRYISGNNIEGEKIAMTTPVYMDKNGSAEVMEFVLPAKYDSIAPEPKGEGLTVYQAKAGYFAAIRYGGYSNESKEKFHAELLVNALKQADKEIIGSPLVLSYDAPYKFYNRRNEILVEVKE